jgi:small subunit ribosomal protein S3
MGQKVSPIALRLGINRTWDSRWFAEKNEYPKLLMEDRKIRSLVNSLKATAAISKIVIERPHKKCNVTIYSARPGILIGKKGSDIELIKNKIQKITNTDVSINILEVKKT